MLSNIVLGVLGLMTVWFCVAWLKGIKEEKSGAPTPHLIAVGFVTNFFDTLGIGSFAPTTAWYKGAKLVQDRIIPGTLNVGHTLPVVVMSFIFIQRVEVEPLTLTLMLVAAVAGAFLGADVVSGLSERKVQFGMGIALFITAIFMLLGMFNLMPSGGEAVGLSGTKLVIAVAVNFILGALMTLGIGLYAPCMALIYALGMSPLVAFPIMMGSCAYLMPTASVKFIKNKAFDKKAALGLAIGGVPAVFVAAYLVTSLPMAVLRWLVVAVILYTAVTMLKSGMESARKEETVWEA
ncbi:TSUP family transporter [Gudongella sp. DL1XJH-153]|uniref:TSUP family transporter n=1 Tax=Gudongella sp. DL1XJH-153 TaxID=3409804 RepID=UPI003BB66FFD